MTNDAIVQVAGRGCRMEVAAFRAAVEANPSLKQLMLRYVLAVITQISQNAARNQLHVINVRCARRLLTTHDRVDGDRFGLTQEYLAMMLGVTRPSVSTAASALKAAGLVNYSRGIVDLDDGREVHTHDKGARVAPGDHIPSRALHLLHGLATLAAHGERNAGGAFLSHAATERKENMTVKPVRAIRLQLCDWRGPRSLEPVQCERFRIQAFRWTTTASAAPGSC